jgi:uroporphyrinogen III methyltransferase / synthase
MDKPDVTKQILNGRTILITRTADQSPELIHEIERRGGKTICFPMIAIAGPDTWESCDRAIINIKKYDGLIFTSVNAVRGFFSRMTHAYPHAADTVRSRGCIAVGEKTNEALKEFGVVSAELPDEYNADAVVRMLRTRDTAGKTFLMPGGNLTRSVIPEGLARLGAVVETVPVYKTTEPDGMDVVRLRRILGRREADVITFFSPSSVEHFFKHIDPALISDIPVAVIGSATYDEARKYGVRPRIVPGEATVRSMTDAIEAYFGNQQRHSK